MSLFGSYFGPLLGSAGRWEGSIIKVCSVPVGIKLEPPLGLGALLQEREAAVSRPQGVLDTNCEHVLSYDDSC